MHFKLEFKIHNTNSQNNILKDNSNIDISLNEFLFKEIERLDNICCKYTIELDNIIGIDDLSKFITDISKSIQLSIKYYHSSKSLLSKNSYHYKIIDAKLSTIISQINKLDDLQKQAKCEIDRILKLPEVIYKPVSWDSITFQDGSVLVALSKQKSEILSESRSKRVYNVRVQFKTTRWGANQPKSDLRIGFSTQSGYMMNLA